MDKPSDRLTHDGAILSGKIAQRLWREHVENAERDEEERTLAEPESIKPSTPKEAVKK